MTIYSPLPKSIHNLSYSHREHDGGGEFSLFGESFPYNDDATRRAAWQAMQDFGVQRLDTMAKQKQGLLSTRERITGKFDQPKPIEVPRTVLRQEAPDPNRNPYTAERERLENSVAHSHSDKVKKAHRIEYYSKLEKQWQEQHAPAPVVEDKELSRAQNHAAKYLAAVVDDPAKTVEQVNRARELKNAIDNSKITVAEFWQSAEVSQ